MLPKRREPGSDNRSSTVPIHPALRIVARGDATPSTTKPRKTPATRRSDDQCKQVSAYRDAICSLCVRTVSLALAVPLSDIQSGTRSGQDAALARQIAMYLCHTTFSMMMTEVGLYFKRDRTTVAHACAVVEDKRDKFSFDLVICQLEALLLEARQALEHQQAMQGQGAGR